MSAKSDLYLSPIKPGNEALSAEPSPGAPKLGIPKLPTSSALIP